MEKNSKSSGTCHWPQLHANALEMADTTMEMRLETSRVSTQFSRNRLRPGEYDPGISAFTSNQRRPRYRWSFQRAVVMRNIALYSRAVLAGLQRPTNEVLTSRSGTSSQPHREPGIGDCIRGQQCVSPLANSAMALPRSFRPYPQPRKKPPERHRRTLKMLIIDIPGQIRVAFCLAFCSLKIFLHFKSSQFSFCFMCC